MTFSKTLFAVLAMTSTAVLAQDASLQCGDASTAELLPLSNFTSLKTGAVCNSGYCDFLMPNEIHWHIYPTAPGTQARQSIQPEGLLTPQVRNGVLSYQLQNVLEPAGYNYGDDIEAGVFLYIPEDQLENIEIAGVDDYVQVHADGDDLATLARSEPLAISSSAVDTFMVVTSPFWPVDIVESGVDNKVYIDAAASSSVDIAGVDTEVFIRCPSLSSLRTRGVDNEVTVEGSVMFGSLEGVDADVEINDSGSSNPCSNITTLGVDNSCDDTNNVLEIDNLSCLADTKLGYGDCSWTHLSTGAQVGIAIGALMFIAAIVIASIYCCRCCCCKRDNRSIGDKMPVVAIPPPMHSFANETSKSEEGTHVTVQEAEVLEVKDSPSTTNFENVDLEQAKQERFA